MCTGQSKNYTLDYNMEKHRNHCKEQGEHNQTFPIWFDSKARVPKLPACGKTLLGTWIQSSHLLNRGTTLNSPQNALILVGRASLRTSHTVCGYSIPVHVTDEKLWWDVIGTTCQAPRPDVLYTRVYLMHRGLLDAYRILCPVSLLSMHYSSNSVVCQAAVHFQHP